MITPGAYEMSFVVLTNSGKNGGRITASVLICSIVHKIVDTDIRMFYLFKRLDTHLSRPNKNRKMIQII